MAVDASKDLATSKSKYSHLGVPDKEWEAFYAEYHNVVPVLVGTPQHLRNIMAELKKTSTGSIPTITEGLDIRDEDMPTSDGSSIALRIYTPKGGATSYPVVIYIHGGGWTLGDLDGEDIVCRATCAKNSVVVVSVDYRLAPEFPFPRGLNDCWEAMNWVRAEAPRLRVDSSAMIIGGSSSGGNLTAVLAHRARDAGIPLKGQILRIPSVCHIEHYPPELELHSMEELKDAPVLCKRAMELFYENLQLKDPANPEMSPLLAPSFQNLAPACVQIAGMDPLRDEGFAYADKLKNAGVPVQIYVYPGLPHAFNYFPPLSSTETYGDDMAAAIKNFLNAS
ncbi:alpha/beta hydrolase fold-3 domain protein [Pyrenochaeta sp. DS3sAY3a]|nr:alpha/beta hydrolase fold-3 domain protein [Pyrenochaeta sp. DS3sAY3a]